MNEPTVFRFVARVRCGSDNTSHVFTLSFSSIADILECHEGFVDSLQQSGMKFATAKEVVDDLSDFALTCLPNG